MKINKIIMLIWLCTSITSCQIDTRKKRDQKEQNMTEPEYSSKYICPMHCIGSGSDTTGSCPVCGMKYQLNPRFKK